jgi:hypothetical protein
MNFIKLPAFGIDIDVEASDGVGTIRSELKSDCPHCSRPNCFFDCDESQSD